MKNNHFFWKLSVVMTDYEDEFLLDFMRIEVKKDQLLRGQISMSNYHED